MGIAAVSYRAYNVIIGHNVKHCKGKRYSIIPSVIYHNMAICPTRHQMCMRHYATAMLRSVRPSVCLLHTHKTNMVRFRHNYGCYGTPIGNPVLEVEPTSPVSVAQ